MIYEDNQFMFIIEKFFSCGIYVFWKKEVLSTLTLAFVIY